MVQAIINIENETNRVLNMVKAKFDLRDKSQAIDKMAQEYQEMILDPELRPEYIGKAQKIIKDKKIHVGSLENFKKRYSVK